MLDKVNQSLSDRFFSLADLRDREPLKILAKKAKIGVSRTFQGGTCLDKVELRDIRVEQAK